jgi:hypothetical protein
MFHFAPGCTVNGKPIEEDEKAALNALQDSMSIASSSPNWTSAEHNGVIIEGTPEFVAMIMGSSNKMPYFECDEEFGEDYVSEAHEKEEKKKSENDDTEKKEPEKKKLKKQNTKEDK